MLLTAQGTPFTTGCASYGAVDPDGSGQQSAIYLPVILPFAHGISVYALIDTGAPFCIFNSDLLNAAGIDFDAGEWITLSTRIGRVNGRIQRLELIVPAQEGDSLSVDASVFVTDEWQHGSFLGYGGFLERLRFAIDPLLNLFYFGAVG